MATNPYSYGSLGQRWTVGEPTSKSLLDVSRVKADANRWALEQLVVDPDDTANFVLTAPGLNIDSNTLYVDSAYNTVGFRLSNPNDYAFDGTPNWVASGGAGNASVIIVSGTTSIGYLSFADGTTGTDRYSGNIQYNHGTNTMSFRTNGGVEAMTINSAQDLAVDTDTLFVDASADRVGINTVSPQVDFHVNNASTNGVARISTSHATSYAQVQLVNQSGNYWYQTIVYGDNSYRLYNGSDRLIVDTSGNMGLGGTPVSNGAGSTVLNVNATTGGATIHLTNNTTGTTNSDGSLFVQSGSDLLFINRESGNLKLRTADTDRLIIDSSGNAGFSVTPSAWSGRTALEIEGASTGYVTSPNGPIAIGSNIYYNGGDKFVGNGYAPLYALSSGNHIWYTSNNNTSGAGAAVTLTQAMTLTNAGLLGIGTASPAAQNVITLQDNANGFVGIRFNGTGSYAHNWSLYGSGDGAGNEFFGVYDATNNAYRIKVDESGGVGVGVTPYSNYRCSIRGASNTSAYHVLQVEDSVAYTLFNVRADGRILTGTRSVSPYNNTTASAANMYVDSSGILYRSTSSAKYKTDVETIEDSYADAILNMRPVWYRSLSVADNANHGWWGFIAEEVAEIDPRLVQYRTTESVINEESGREETVTLGEPIPEGVSYDRFVPLLLNLIQRQQQSIETLETKVAALEAA